MEGNADGRGHLGQKKLRSEQVSDVGDNAIGSFATDDWRMHFSESDEDVGSPLPLFQHCSEIHNSNAPQLPAEGEISAEEHEQNLFSWPPSLCRNGDTGGGEVQSHNHPWDIFS